MLYLLPSSSIENVADHRLYGPRLPLIGSLVSKKCPYADGPKSTPVVECPKHVAYIRWQIFKRNDGAPLHQFLFLCALHYTLEMRRRTRKYRCVHAKLSRLCLENDTAVRKSIVTTSSNRLFDFCHGCGWFLHYRLFPLEVVFEHVSCPFHKGADGVWDKGRSTDSVELN